MDCHLPNGPRHFLSQQPSILWFHGIQQSKLPCIPLGKIAKKKCTELGTRTPTWHQLIYSLITGSLSNIQHARESQWDSHDSALLECGIVSGFEKLTLWLLGVKLPIEQLRHPHVHKNSTLYTLDIGLTTKQSKSSICSIGSLANCSKQKKSPCGVRSLGRMQHFPSFALRPVGHSASFRIHCRAPPLLFLAPLEIERGRWKIINWPAARLIGIGDVTFLLSSSHAVMG